MVLSDPDAFAKETREMLESLEVIDMRWRPMRTAPAGRLIEVLLQRESEHGLFYQPAFMEIEEGDEVTDALFWREAHPDWQEVGTGLRRRWEKGD